MQEILHLFVCQKQFPTRKIFSIILLQFRELFFYTLFGELLSVKFYSVGEFFQKQ